MRTYRIAFALAAVLAMHTLPAAAEELPHEPLALWRWEQPTRAETAVLAAAVALIWVDTLQTRDYFSRPHAPGTWMKETNPFLGARPSPGRVFWIGGVLPTVLLTGIWYALPTGWRIVPCGGVIGGEAWTVAQNAMNGLTLRF